MATPTLFFGVRGGYYNSDRHDSNVTNEPRYIFGSTNIGMPGVPVDMQRVSGFTSFPAAAFNGTVRDQQTRANFQADGTVYAKGGGEHQIKFGVQIDKVGNNVLAGEVRNRVTLNWDTALPSGVPVTRGQYRLLRGPEQRRRRRRRASSPRATSARRTSASSSRTRGPSRIA